MLPASNYEDVIFATPGLINRILDSYVNLMVGLKSLTMNEAVYVPVYIFCCSGKV